MSMSEQPDHIKLEYDLYALERDRMELEQRMIEQERREQDLKELDAVRAESILSDVEQQELDEDDQRWDAAWDAWLDELYANEQIERDHDEDDQRRNDR